jgi:dCMP deaminase
MFNEKWDLRFLELAKLISTFSKDPSTKCGAVIVRPDKTIASTGFNGFPQLLKDNSELYDNRDIKYSRIIHGEVNALLFAKEPVTGYTLYTTGPCCDRCAVQMIQAGIKRFVAYTAPDMEVRWGEAFKRTFSYYEEAGLEHKEYQKPL